MPEAGAPTLVVISGPPGSGLTSLARAIAQAIPCPAISRDEIKEGMVHAEGGEFETAPGDPATRRTFPLFFDVLRVLLEGGVTTVAEASFQDPLWRRGLEPLAELAHLRIVHCNVDAAVSLERVARRPASRRAVSRHQVNAEELEERKRAFAAFDRVSLPAPALDVDTTDGYVPGLPAIVAFVDAHDESAGSAA